MNPTDPAMNLTGESDSNHGAYKFVKEVFAGGKADKLAAYGYSHGGGCVYFLSAMIYAVVNHDGGGMVSVPGGDPQFQIEAAPEFKAKWQADSLSWTAYIDAVKVELKEPETRLPFLTKNHFNRFQDQPYIPDLPFRGAATENAEATLGEGVFDQNNTDAANDQNPAFNRNLYGPKANTKTLWNPPLGHLGIQKDPAVLDQFVPQFVKRIWDV